ncbi:MAG: serine protease [Methylophilaceae bacterium]|nr:serine protease [Methylophilaceae bacterium]
MKKIFLIGVLVGLANSVQAQPDIVKLLQLHDSIVQISVELENGTTGTGTGVVVSPEYVITNCHVIANGKGANVAKYGDGYKPLSIKADWKHDLCALKFDGLPFKPVPMRDSESLENEEEIFSIGYPNGNNVPQPSYGTVKAKYPFEGSTIVRSDAAFGLGSSGGALFDQQFNLIGITTFKSPGPNGYFYSLPVEWIKRLLQSPELDSLATNETPFWALPLEKQPYFMKVVIPYQNREWQSLNTISTEWSSKEPKTEDAWYFLALSEIGLNKLEQAKFDLERVVSQNPRHLDALKNLFKLANQEKDFTALEKIRAQIKKIDNALLDELEANTGEVSLRP